MNLADNCVQDSAHHMFRRGMFTFSRAAQLLEIMAKLHYG